MSQWIKDSLSPKHKSLRLIATMAKVLGWIAFVGYMVQAIVTLMAAQQAHLQPLITTSQESVVSWLSWSSSFGSKLLDGVVYWLILQGVSLGLNMLVETDLNYRNRSQGERHE